MPERKKIVLQALYLSHHQELRQFLIRRVGEQDAADLLQETWLHFIKLADTHSVQMPRAFLYKVAANIVIDFGRKTKRTITFSEAELEQEMLHSPGPAPDVISDGYWQFERFTNALNDLPEIDRQAFILNKMNGLTHAQIAIELRLSEKSVQRKIVKVLNHCIKRLAS